MFLHMTHHIRLKLLHSKKERLSLMDNLSFLVALQSNRYGETAAKIIKVRVRLVWRRWSGLAPEAQNSRGARVRTAEAKPRRFNSSQTRPIKKPPLKGGFFIGGTESRKNAHRIISDKQNGILLPSRFAAIRLSAIRQTISRKPGLMPCRWLAPCKRLSLRLYRSALTAVLLVPYLAANRHICFCFRRWSKSR